MNNFAIILTVSLISLASAIPVHNGMVFYQMPYYNPYQQAMLVHYAQPMSRTGSATSAFASGDSIAAGSFLKENRVQNEVALTSEPQSANDAGNVEAIAEAYPEDAPAQDTILYGSEQQNQPNLNEVIPLNVAPVSENSDDKAVVIQEEPFAPTTLPPPSPPTTTTTATAAPVVPKKKVHIALDIPDASTSDDDEHDDVEDEYGPVRPQKPNRQNKGQSPTYTYFPLTFGRTAGGTVAIANAYSTGRGAVRSHAIAYGTSSGSSRQQAAKRHISDKQ